MRGKLAVKRKGDPVVENAHLVGGFFILRLIEGGLKEIIQILLL